MQQQIAKVLEGMRSYLQEDGGDVEFVSFDHETGVACVRLMGNCRTCPISSMTLRAGIERMLKLNVPEIVRVEAVP